jgi:4-amino-4-deoxy-L-arabinose transferase-like glycosyltransferase
VTRRTASIAIAVAIVVGLALRLVAWSGTIASDDLTHAYAAMHLWDDPVEHAVSSEPGSAYTVNARRVGVNLPLAAGVAIAGPSEATFGTVALVESLLVILACALWAGALAGRRAAVIAAALAAVTPVDVWHATIWLQDGLFAALLAAGMAAAAWAVRTEQPRWWLATGMALGYLQYVKENASFLIVALAVVGLVRTVRARRIDRGTAWMIAGVVVMQALAAAYWWAVMGDPLYYVDAWIGRQTSVEAAPPGRPFPENLLRLGQYVTYDQALGVGHLVAAWFAVRWLRLGDAPARIRQDATVVAVLQVLVLLHVLRWSSSTQRYLMQIVPVVVALGAAGLADAWTERSARWRNVALAAILASAAIGIFVGRPQHGPFRADVVRRAVAALPRLAPTGTPVFVVMGVRPTHYTDRAAALIAEYEAPPWQVITDPSTVTRGLVVYCHLEHQLMLPVEPPGKRVFHTSTRGGREWLEIYAVDAR